jgi:hypothetical protein
MVRGWPRNEERGTCYVALRRPELAEAALGAALGQKLSSRRRGGVLVDLALLGLQRRDLDQLLIHSSAALDIAQQTGSGVIGRKIQDSRPPAVSGAVPQGSPHQSAQHRAQCGARDSQFVNKRSVTLPNEQGRVFREAWIAGVKKYFPGEPKSSYITPWDQTPDWERASAAAVYDQVRALSRPQTATPAS